MTRNEQAFRKKACNVKKQKPKSRTANDEKARFGIWGIARQGISSQRTAQ
jgi:hypothetical protein